MTGSPLLVLHNSYRPHRLGPDRVALNAKHLEVLEAWGAAWPGEVSYLMETVEHREPDMTVEISHDELPLTVRPIDRTQISSAWFPDDAMVAAALETGFRGLHRHVSRADERLVRGSDYPPGVARRIMIVTTRDQPLRLARRLVWLERERLRQIHEVRHAAALQSNQFATIDYFRRWCDNRVAFIDTRMRPGDAATDEQMERRRSRYASGEPLHLCFSGRIDPMKSPLDIAEVARGLRDREIPFRYSVFGDGPLLEPLANRVAELGLADQVDLRGFLDFRSELLPLLKEEVDVFLGIHRQGDTSTTYPEMMACGVPVVSYPNRAVRALQRNFGVGTLADSIDVTALVETVARLHRDRVALREAADRDHAWGREQTLERAYETRVDHLLELRDRSSAAS